MLLGDNTVSFFAVFVNDPIIFALFPIYETKTFDEEPQGWMELLFKKCFLIEIQTMKSIKLRSQSICSLC